MKKMNEIERKGRKRKGVRERLGELNRVRKKTGRCR